MPPSGAKGIAYGLRKGVCPLSQTQSRGIFYMLACAFLWSIGGLFIKLIDWNPFFIAGARSLIGAAVLMVYMKLAHLSLKINRRSIVSGIALCSVFFCYVTANKLTTAANTVVLQYTNPVFVVLLSSLFLHQKFSRRDLFLVGTVFFGVALSFLDGMDAGGFLGNLLALFSGFFLAVLFLNSARCETASDSMSGILLGQLFARPVRRTFPIFRPSGLYHDLGGQHPHPGGVPAGPSLCVLRDRQPDMLPIDLFCAGRGGTPAQPAVGFCGHGERPSVTALIGCGIVVVTITVWCVQNAKLAQS